MSGETPTNGVYVRFREYCADRDRRDRWEAKMEQEHEATDERVDDLERKWDRIAGPIMIGVSGLSVIALVSNILVVWLR